MKRMRLILYRSAGQIISETRFFPLIMNGFQSECQKQGIEMTVSYLEQGTEDFEQQIQKLNEENVPVVMVGTEIPDQEFHCFEHLTCPVIMLDYWNENLSFSAVLIDNEEAMLSAMSYLESRGHEKIGYLKSRFRTKANIDKEYGYLRGMRSRGLKADSEYTLDLMNSMEGSYQEMKKYLSRKLKLPTAFVADNDVIALGAMKALQEAGVRVPEDVSLIGFGDIPYSAISIPGLTSMGVSQKLLGQLAVQQALKLCCEKKEEKTKILVCPRLVERDSVKTLKQETGRKKR